MAVAGAAQQLSHAHSRPNQLVPGNATRDLAIIEAKFLDFARARGVGTDRREATRLGRFSAHAGCKTADLFGAADMAYAAHILGQLPAMTDADGRVAWAKLILSFQSDDGWFRAGDRQGHGVEHATAYALGALAILAPRESTILRAIKPFTSLQTQLAPHPGRDSAPFTLSLLDRLHFWRGSHRAGGIPAIVGAVRDLGLEADKLLGLSDPTAWLGGWWDWFAARIDPSSGYWRLAPKPMRLAFNAIYRRRHHPETAAMGGAVHLYWIAERLGRPFPYPHALIASTTRLLQPTGLYEREPYCIDLDGTFLIARSLRDVDTTHPAAANGIAALAANRRAVVEWFLARDPAAWNATSHKLPGAFAAIAEADLALLPPGKRRWHDVFATTWWL